MLHAVANRKTRFHHRYHSRNRGERDELSQRVQAEDEIVSTVFGPLDFMETKQVYQFWQEVFQQSGKESVLPDEPPDRLEMKLWPRRPGCEDRTQIEPDAHLSFVWPDGSQTDVLIEIKWRAPLSGHDQLHRQWMHYLSQKEKKRCWHVFIGLDTSTASDRAAGNVWRVAGDDRLVLLSWAQVRDVLSNFQGHSDGLGRWAEKANYFLEQVEIRRFKGFAQAICKLPKAHITIRRIFGGLTHGFSGFRLTTQKLSDSEYVFQSFFSG